MLFLNSIFYLPEHLSPTYHQLSHYLLANGWIAGSFEQADFGTKNFQFYADATECLEYKHRLAELVQQYCPDIMPLTYVIDEDNWPNILHHLANQLSLDPRQKAIWILKPALLNNGQHIKLFVDIDTIRRYFASTNRLGGPYVLQSYIHSPHLLRDNRKYSIRHFMVLSSDQGAFLYPYGYYNVARQPFDGNNLANLSAHLTNEHLYGQEPNVIQIPSQLFSWHNNYYRQIKTILRRLIKGLKQQYPDALNPSSERTLALFGMDFMVDSHQRVWLLEANHGPCFPVETTHPLQEPLYKDFWQAFIANFVTLNRSQVTVFESI